MNNETEDEKNKPNTPITEEDKKAFAPLTEKEKENALERATLPEQEQLAAKTKELSEALEIADPAILSDHVRAELGIEQRPVKPSEEVKEVEEEMKSSKKDLTGKKPYRDELKNPAEKATSNPSSGPKTKQGRMFGKKGRKGK